MDRGRIIFLGLIGKVRPEERVGEIGNIIIGVLHQLNRSREFDLIGLADEPGGESVGQIWRSLSGPDFWQDQLLVGLSVCPQGNRGIAVMFALWGKRLGQVKKGLNFLWCGDGVI